jgi:hypothetical protein
MRERRYPLHRPSARKARRVVRDLIVAWLQRCTLAAVLLLSHAGVQADTKAKMYRWVDEQGNVHYTDQVPPDDAQRGHTQLSDHGIPLKVVPPPKTPEERERERELERLRLQQERLVEQQRESDRALLRTYRTVDDVTMAREGKLAAIDVIVGVARANIRRQQERLATLRNEAADFERTGKPVPQRLVDSLANAERYIREAYSSIVDREHEKNRVRAEFARNLERFRQLKDIPPDASAAQNESEAVRQTLQNLLPCGDAERCDRYWERAVAYVRSRATTEVQSVGENVLITAPPRALEDVNLTLSRLPDRGSPTSSIFLDLQCKNRSVTDTNCTSPRAAAILTGFRAAVADPGDAAQPTDESEQVPGENKGNPGQLPPATATGAMPAAKTGAMTAPASAPVQSSAPLVRDPGIPTRR